MAEKIANITILRFDPSVDQNPYEQTYAVPVAGEMAVLQALDYIYEHIDSTLAYPDHGACAQGICKQCTLDIDGKPALMCQTLVTGDLHLQPPKKFEVVKDLVYRRGGKKHHD